MRHLLSFTCLTPIALIAVGPVFAETVFKDARTTPVRTATANAGAPDSVTIDTTGSIKLTSGTAINMDSNHAVANKGAITIADASNAVGIFAFAGTNGVILCQLLGLDPVPWEWDRFVTGHASITRLTSIELGDGHTFSLTKLSDVEHLAIDDRTG